MTVTALLFPGQGSQERGMGRDVAEAMPEAMELWKKAERGSGLALREIYWESGDEGLMADTRGLQPALTVVNLSLWLALAPSVRPACTAGHSLGEYSALAAAGVLPVDAVLELVCLRGRLMAEADPDGRGGMAAVLKLSRQEVEDVAESAAAATGEVLLVANYNTPAQFVLSGGKAAVEAAVPLVRERKGRAMPLPVSGAFHSPLMAPAAKAMNTLLDRLTWSKPRFAVYSNVTGAAVTDGESLRDLAGRQMISPVLWIDSIAGQYRDGVRRWLEVGPKGVLSRMVKPIVDEAGTDAIRVDALGSLEAVQAFGT
jgi:[acyl-carrier-protein] S-malonyltransferase